MLTGEERYLDWKDDVLFPVMPQSPTPEQQAQFERAAQVAKFFGGQPRSFRSLAARTAPLLVRR